ncbi:MAG: hypothetical protein QOE93_376 [Actinomycetota bacterium]|jgi:hypothetical protein|nr:hypothetical protein [Actinomycetota bacterium]
MFEKLVEAIGELDIPVDGQALVQVLAFRDQLNARIVEAVGEFDEYHMWNLDGSVSMTAWLRSSASMTTRSASKLASMGRRLRQLPTTAAAYAEGKLSEGKVEAILAQLNDATVAVFAEHEDELIPFFEPLSVAGCARLHRVVTSGRSAILDYGTSTRTIPAPLWSALVIRDEHCRSPGCDRPSTW